MHRQLEQVVPGRLYLRPPVVERIEKRKGVVAGAEIEIRIVVFQRARQSRLLSLLGFFHIDSPDLLGRIAVDRSRGAFVLGLAHVPYPLNWP